MAHLCGLCLALRDEHGHASRVVTNYDGLLVSVLTEAQAVASAPQRRAGACALRGFKGADVVEAEGVRLAASVSLILAAGKVRDHVADGDGVYARKLVAAAAERVAARWSASGSRTATALGFAPEPLTRAVEAQALLEGTPGLGLLELTGPTEEAVAAAFEHTALLAGKPHNRETLREAGRHFGRLAHLLDAVEDLARDRADGAYNPLLASGTDLTEARRYADDALLGLELAVAELDLEKRSLVKALLVKETGRSVARVFAAGGPDAAETEEEAPGAPPRDPRLKPDPGGLLSMMCAAMACCTCGLYRPPWDEDRYKPCSERCDGGGCDGCGSCCDGCSGCCECCSCSSDSCNCDCNCG
ncbi:hypothetical protein FHS43_002812 [Streptosporangium becharense]|uniref:Regulatory protein n=2 Tax=Streptosporangium becharense TaxID=1816182 RepID=A0A7W9MJJ0_9ACTN|nr:hypothetical protein [Streptosporangium becharense]MBB5822643.1 hypothetical protein [Streptosporangium becharense]